MHKKTITVTEAARNFSDCVNRVHYQNLTFVLLKNGAPFARLAPENPKVCLGRDLAEALAGFRLTASEARAWYGEMRRARRKLQAPEKKWP